jgi:hypothetical protein
MSQLAEASTKRSDLLAHRALRALPCLVAVLPFVVLAVRVLLRRENPVYSGDGALLELAVRSAAHADRAVGPYSRFNFFHPGPIMFYVLSPLEWLTGGAPWALPLGVDLFNAVVVAVFVVLVQRSTLRWPVARRTSPGAVPDSPTATDSRNSLLTGTAAAVVVLAYVLAVDVGLLQILWNSLVIMLPVGLLLVAAAFVDGWGWAAALTAVAGTFAAQTNVSTVPVVIAAAACALVWLARDVISRRRPGLSDEDAGIAAPPRAEGESRRWLARGMTLTVAGIAVLAWVPPVVQQLTTSPGNLGRLWLFFRSSGEPQPSWRSAAAFAGRELAVFPSRIVWKGTLTADTVNQHRGVLAFVGFVVIATTLIAVAAMRRSRPAMRLGVVSLVGALAAVYSMASVRGPVYWYLGAYMSAIGVPLLLGWLILAIDAVGIWGPRMIVASLCILTLLAVVSATTTPINDNRAFPNEPTYRANTEAAWRVVEPIVANNRGHHVVLAGDPALLPTIAGVALKIEQSGVTVLVTAPLVPWFGSERLARRESTRRISITSGPVPVGYRIVGYAPSRLLSAPIITVSIS